MRHVGEPAWPNAAWGAFSSIKVPSGKKTPHVGAVLGVDLVFVLCSRTLHLVESMVECHVGIALAFTPRGALTRPRLESTASNLCKGRGQIGDSRPAIVSIVSPTPTETGLPTLPPSVHSGS